MRRAAALGAALGLVAAVFAAAAQAQTHSPTVREAISPTLSPELAGQVFQDAALNGCVAAVGKGSRLQAVMGARVAANGDAKVRSDVGATADETVFDVLAGKGVVTVREKPGRCVASVYGPPASATVSALSRRLTDMGFERLASPADGFAESLTKTSDGRRVQVMIHGTEPGMPGHKSRFSVVTATVFATPAG